jgi:HK97 family phage major capsid protein
MPTINEELTGLKQMVVELKRAYENDSKRKDEIINDLKLKQARFETSRKGMFTGADDDIDQISATGGTDYLGSLLMAKTKSEQIQEFQQANDEILIVSQLLNLHPTQTKIYHNKMREIPFLRKVESLGSGGSAGYGTDWVPTGYSTRLFDLMSLNLEVAVLFESLNMPTSVYKLPIISADSQAYLLSENVAQGDFVTAANLIKATQPTTGNATLTAKKLGGRVEFSEELNEDSVVPVLPMIQRNLVKAMTAAEENAIINGDDGGTHMDYNVTNSYDCRKAWDGLRYHTQSAAKMSLNTFNGDNIAALRAKMGKYGIRPSECAWITGISVYNQLMTLRDNSTNGNLLMTTVDKYGSGATILKGELGKLFGIPVIVSEYIQQDLNGSGIYDGSMTDRTIMILVNKTQFIRGDRRTMKVKVAEQIQVDQTLLVGTCRKAFCAIPDVTSNYIVAQGINIVA